jgi:mono/diheme cytochrome c family protein
MPAWHEHSLQELLALAVYVHTLGPAAGAAEPLAAAEQTLARKLFTENCARCHGATGRGDGLAAAALAPAPTDFTAIHATPAYAEQALAQGVPGTAMVPWAGKLSVAQRRLLARYVRSLR